MTQLIFRICTYISGLFTLALGTVLFTCCQLGVSALVSVPFTLTTFLPLTLGEASTMSFAFMIIFQLLLVRKLQWGILLQFPASIVFGTIVDFYNLGLDLGEFRPDGLPVKILLLALATGATSLGTFLMVRGNFVLNPPDGTVRLISYRTDKSFGQVKFYFDLTMVTISLTMGLVFTGQIKAVGIGTLLAVLLVGRLIQLLERRFPVVEATVEIEKDEIA